MILSIDPNKTFIEPSMCNVHTKPSFFRINFYASHGGCVLDLLCFQFYLYFFRFPHFTKYDLKFLKSQHKLSNEIITSNIQRRSWNVTEIFGNMQPSDTEWEKFRYNKSIEPTQSKFQAYNPNKSLMYLGLTNGSNASKCRCGMYQEL